MYMNTWYAAPSFFVVLRLLDPNFESLANLKLHEALQLSHVHVHTVEQGGAATTMEMCLGYLMYYPKRNISNFETLPSYLFDPEAEIFSELSIKPQ